LYCNRHSTDSAFCTKMDRFGKKLNLSKASAQIYGCQLSDSTGLTREVCQRINLGQCACTEEKCKDCDVWPSENPQDWYKEAPHNTYAQWVMRKGSYYAFSLFDIQANKQCLGSQLDVITCPQCSVDPSPPPQPQPPSPPPPTTSCCSKCTGFPNFEATCKATPFYCEPKCGSEVKEWCNADGQHKECRFCGGPGQAPCPDQASSD
jgi:hypothetical protein